MMDFKPEVPNSGFVYSVDNSEETTEPQAEVSEFSPEFYLQNPYSDYFVLGAELLKRIEPAKEIWGRFLDEVFKGGL